MAPNYVQSVRAKIKAMKNHAGKISSLEDKKRKGEKCIRGACTVGPNSSKGFPNIQ